MHSNNGCFSDWGSTLYVELQCTVIMAVSVTGVVHCMYWSLAL